MTDQPPTDRIRQRPPRRWPPNWVTPRPAAAGDGMPRWVKVFGSVGLVLVLLVVVMLLTGHGPGRHMHGGLPGHVPAVGSGEGRA